MVLPPGTRLGPYEITAQIGTGGMGEVYRATDTNLKRAVAIKVLPASLAQNADRLARFQREAETLAALNHPHIAHLYGLEKLASTPFLVMELVEGDDLSQRIARGAMPVDEVLPVARQIAEALEAAHEQNIIHRDLKPANIKVRDDGTVKVLDFGLAKALDPPGTSNATATVSPTLSIHATQAGVILGTAAYMAPEQARARSVDKRADIWAFGAVVYEMLTGARAFDGDDVSITLAAVLKEEPDWSALPAETPPGLRRLLTRCLKKDPKERLRDIGDARTEMADLITRVPDPVSAMLVAPTTKGLWSRVLPWPVTAVAIVATAILAGAVMYLLRTENAPQVVRFTVAPPEKLNFNLMGGNLSGVAGSQAFNGGAIAPDGRKLAFTTQDAAGTVQIWIHSLDALSAQPVQGTEGATLPFWSPDSRFLGFFAGGKLKKVDVAGGPPQTLTNAPNGRGGATWSREGVIVFALDQNSGLMRVPDAGGEPTAVTRLQNGETAHRQPSFLPDDRHFLYRSFGQSPQIMLGSLDSPEVKPVLFADSQAVYSSGHLLFVRDATLMAQPFDASARTLGGAAFPVAEQVATDNNGLSAFDASASGVLTYRTGVMGATSQLTWFDRTGKVVGTVDNPGTYNAVSLSPDGTRAAVSRTDAQAERSVDIWIHELARGTSTRLTSDPATDSYPVWSPDGSRVVWSSGRDGSLNLYQRPSNGTGSDEAVLKSNDQKYASDWSPDERFLLYATRTHLFFVPLAGNDRQPRSYVQSEFDTQGRFSPDGNFVAYASSATSRLEIYVQPFPDASKGKWKVSQGGGSQPRWRRDGKELFFISADSQLMAVETSTGSTFAANAAPKALFRAPIYRGGSPGGPTRYDVTPDGQKFLINAAMTDSTTSAPITVVLNWTAGIKK